MHRTVGDSYGTSSGKNIYRAEVPAVSDATQVTYDAMNSLQEEIANVIEAEGIALNTSAEAISAMTQLNTAIDAKVSAEATLRNTADSLIAGELDGWAYAIRRYISGYQMENNSGDAYALDIGSGGCGSDNDEPVFGLWPNWIFQGQQITKTIQNVWSAAPASGGRASGAALATGWWHVFAFGNASGGYGHTVLTGELGFDTSITAANLKTDTGWGSNFMYRRIGSVYYDATIPGITSFHQRGDLFLWDTPYLHGSPATITAGSPQTFVPNTPPGISVEALLNITMAVAAPALFRIEVADGPLGSGALAGNCPSFGGYYGWSGDMKLVTDTTPNVFWESKLGGTVIVGNLYTRGWYDWRGKQDNF